MRRVTALTGAALVAVTAAGYGSKAKTLPSVQYVNFVAAFQRLHGAGFKVEVPYFPPFGSTEPAEQGRGQLSNYVVVRERRVSGDTVALTLTLTLPRFQGLLGSLWGARTGEPLFLSAPDLVGQTYTAATKRAGDYTVSGFWLRVSTVDPLGPRASGSGLAAFRVGSQVPRQGTRLLFGGLVPHRGGVRPASSTITVALTTGGQTTAAEAGRRAEAALRASAETGAGLGPFPRTATALACRIPEGGPRARHVYGECFTGVDLSGKNAVVVYRQLWDGRDFRANGAPARPDLEHVWEVTVSPGGRVLSVRSFGAFPPQLVR